MSRSSQNRHGHLVCPVVILTPSPYRAVVMDEAAGRTGTGPTGEMLMELASRIGMAGPASIEIGRRLWVVVPPSTVDSDGTRELRDVLVAALDRGALNLVVDLTTVAELSVDAADVLSAVSGTLLARGGLLWLANIGGEGYSFSILPVDERGLASLVGLSPVLDAVLLGEASVGGDLDA